MTANELKPRSTWFSHQVHPGGATATWGNRSSTTASAILASRRINAAPRQK